MDTAGQRATGASSGAVVVLAVNVLFAVVVLTALYGPQENSDRAFRLLDWFKRPPEPAAPEPEPSARRRTRQGTR